MIPLLSVLLVGGCGPGASSEVPVDDSGSPPHTGDSAVDGGSGVTDGTCEGYSEGSAVSFDTVYSGAVSSNSAGDPVAAQLFEDEASWTAFLATLTLEEGEPAVVDFDSARVAAALVYVPGTCGLSVTAVAVTQGAGEPAHVDLTVTDASGGCDTACSMVGQALVAVSLPRDDAGPPTVCARLADGC